MERLETLESLERAGISLATPSIEMRCDGERRGGREGVLKYGSTEAKEEEEAGEII